MGIFIAIYGINNIGKTTQAKRLALRLRRLGKRAAYLKYPIYNQKPTGPLLNRVLRGGKKQKMKEEQLQLLFVLNRYQFQPKLLEMLKKGTIIVAEDYTETGIAWGTAKGAHPAEMESMNKFLVQEDLGILFEGKRVLRSKEKGHIHEQNDLISRRCQKIFAGLAKGRKWARVKVSPDKDITAARLWKIVRGRV